MELDDLRNRFTFHPAVDDGTKAAHELVRDLCHDAARKLNVLLDDGREKSLAITHLEEVMFWSNAAIARSQS